MKCAKLKSGDLICWYYNDNITLRCLMIIIECVRHLKSDVYLYSGICNNGRCQLIAFNEGIEDIEADNFYRKLN